MFVILPQTVNGIAQPKQAKNTALNNNVNTATSGSILGFLCGLLVGGETVVGAAMDLPHFQHARASSGSAVWQLEQIISFPPLGIIRTPSLGSEYVEKIARS